MEGHPSKLMKVREATSVDGAKRRQPKSFDVLSDDVAVSNGADMKSTILESLYSAYFADLIRYLYKAFGEGPPDPEDVAQEAFRRLAEQKDLSLIDNQPAFLWRTARNLIVSDKRRDVTRSKYDFEIEHLFFAISSPGLSPEHVLEVKEQLRIIGAELQKMPERRRKAFLWHRIDGLNFTEVGRKLGIDRRAVVRHISIAATDIEIALRKATGASQ